MISTFNGATIFSVQSLCKEVVVLHDTFRLKIGVVIVINIQRGMCHL